MHFAVHNLLRSMFRTHLNIPASKVACYVSTIWIDSLLTANMGQSRPLSPVSNNLFLLRTFRFLCFNLGTTLFLSNGICHILPWNMVIVHIYLPFLHPLLYIRCFKTVTTCFYLRASVVPEAQLGLSNPCWTEWICQIWVWLADVYFMMPWVFSPFISLLSHLSCDLYVKRQRTEGK